MSFLVRAIAFAAVIFVGVSHAAAQETCLAYQQGTVGCPNYGAPAATAVPGPSMDGGVATVPGGSSVTLFGGNVPPNGFMVRVYSSNSSYGPPPNACFVNDNGAAGQGVGFFLVPDIILVYNGQVGTDSATFASPHGYKPMGPVSIWCSYSVSLAARGW
jgi:hypothetical protein